MNKSRAVQGFWSWFADHADELAQVDLAGVSATGVEPAVLAELSAQLRRVARRLTYELGATPTLLPGESAQPDGLVRHLIVSADGDRKAFTDAWAVIEQAPTLPGWRMTALRPRHPDPATLVLRTEYGEVTPAVVRFAAVTDRRRPGTLHLDVFVPVPGGRGGKQAAAHVGFLLLDTLLGEYDTETRLGALTFHAADGRMPADLPSLLELPALVDALPAPDLR